jgi:hypothetical protein
MRCIVCHRPMKAATPDGLGPVCRKRATPIPKVERDMFGYDIAAAEEEARRTLAVLIEQQSLAAHFHVRAAFRAAKVRAGVLPK